MRFRFHVWILAAALVIPTFVAGPASSAGAQTEVAPLKVGVLMPFTGDLSDFGQPMYNSVELAANQINEAGGVNGVPIELVRADSATSPQQSVEEARRLIEIEGVSAVIGPAGSGSTLQVVESVTGPAGVLEISGSATSPALTTSNDNDMFFRTTISDAAQGVVMAEIAREQGYATACTMYVNNAYGQGLSKSFSDAFQANGGTVTAQVPHEQEQPSYASELATCLKDSPDVLVAMSYPESLRVYVREAIESGNAPAFLFSDGGRSPELFADLGWDSFQGVYGTSAGAPETTAGASFDEAYKAAYGDAPSIPYLRENYDAMYVLALAAEAADSVDPTTIRDKMREVSNEPGTVVEPGVDGWKAAVEDLSSGGDINYEGASGSLDFDDNGDVSKGTIVIWKIEGEEVKVVESRNVDLTGGGAAGTPAADASPASGG